MGIRLPLAAVSPLKSPPMNAGVPMRIRSMLSMPRLRELDQAKKKKLVTIRVSDLRKFTHDKHRTIDDTPYGGGAGMILKPEPIFECVESLQSKRRYDEVIYLSADGELLDQRIAVARHRAVVLVDQDPAGLQHV